MGYGKLVVERWKRCEGLAGGRGREKGYKDGI